MPDQLFLHFANLVLALHIGFVVFVVVGLIVIYLGYFLGWPCVRNFVFRILHILAIGVVAVQSWFGVICPLTTLEMWLRSKAGGDTYSGSFIQHWMQDILYIDAPAWVFTVCYTFFGALVLASWFVVSPKKAPVRKPLLKSG